jgi:hypothetical protein
MQKIGRRNKNSKLLCRPIGFYKDVTEEVQKR